jgi:GTPase SAR1 family protein
LAYLRGLEEGSKHLFEAKLVLVGEGEVGKTCLREALLGNKFEPGRPTTHGIEVRKLVVEHPEKDEKIVLNMWDFGGQKVYRVTHQFFFSRRGLYLVVWKPREGVEENNVDEWVERIQLRVGKEARVLVVATHCETGGRIARIDKEGLRRKYGEMICGFHEIDSETGKGVDELQKAIAQVASGLPQMGEEFSIRWDEAREEVMSLSRPQIEYTKFSDICEKHNLDETSTKTLATLMHELGQIVYHAEDEGLQDMVVLEPEWLTKAISLILEDKPTNEAKGELEHGRLRGIWFEHKLEEVERYEPRFHPYFLRLMEKFDVSYRLEDCNSSLVGQLVPDERPDNLTWTPEDDLGEKEAGLSLVCQMEQDPPGLVPWLIVRTHRYSERQHWQGGMFLNGKEHGKSFIELVDRELRIDVRGTYPAHLMSLLSDSVTCLIQQRWPGLNYNLAVPCLHIDENGKACNGRFELDALRQFKAEDDVTIRCQKCRERQTIDRLLVGFEPPGMDFHEQLEETLRLLEEAKTERSAYASACTSQVAEISRRILKALATETQECPRLFSLLPVKGKKTDIGKETYILTLWCEHPGKEHPVCKIGSDGEGEYKIKQAKEWLVKIAPYASLIARTLKTVVPIGGAVVKAAADETLLKEISGKLDLMEKTVSTLLEGDLEAGRKFDEPNRLVSRAEGEGLRQLQSVLNELDKSRKWGGLRRVPTQTGDYLWVCKEHYREYDPGLPVL